MISKLLFLFFSFRYNKYGTPFFFPMIEKTISITKSEIVIYFNSDLLFDEHIIKLLNVLSNEKKFFNKELLIVGRRGDIYWKNITNYSNHDQLWKRSTLHPPSGIDYFIFTRRTFTSYDKKILNKIVVGRVRYDNVILSLALKNRSNIVIDSTYYVKAIHLGILKYEKKKINDVYMI